VTYEDNKDLIRGLWPTAAIEPAMADLFAERLSCLNQDVLREAIKEARISSRFHTPELGEILNCYHKSKRLSSDSWVPKRPRHKPTPTPGVDPDEEEQTIRDIQLLQQAVEHTVEAVEELIERILDAMIANRIGSVETCRQLIPLQALRFTLMGRPVKDDALEEAQRIWPGLRAHRPPEATADDMPGEWDLDVSSVLPSKMAS